MNSERNETKPKRVLHFVPGFRSGGIESLLMNFYSYTDKENLQFDFIVDTLDELPEFSAIREQGGRVFQTGRYLDNPISYQKLINDIFKDHASDYIALHSHTVIRALPILIAAKKHNIKKRILHSHTDSLKGSFYSWLSPVISMLTIPFGTGYLACSISAGKFFFNRKKFTVLKNSIDVFSFIFRPYDRDRVRKELQVNDTDLLIGHTGRFTYQKNHERIIQIFFDLLQKHPNSKLILVGSGPLESNMKSLTEKLCIADSVIFVGLKDNVAPFLSAMDVFLLPSHFEGFCISLLEAQANGLPCVSADVIPDEVNLTQMINTCSLGDANAAWIKKIEMLIIKGRGDSRFLCRKIKDLGFDSDSEFKKLITIYYA